MKKRISFGDRVRDSFKDFEYYIPGAGAGGFVGNTFGKELIKKYIPEYVSFISREGSYTMFGVRSNPAFDLATAAFTITISCIGSALGYIAICKGEEFLHRRNAKTDK